MRTRGPARPAENEQLQTLRRGLAMLEALAAWPEGATPKELSQTLGLHLSTTYRLLNTLVASGYAARSLEGGLFRLGSRVAYLNHGYLAAASPPPGVVPFVHALQLATGETVMFNQLEGDDIVAAVIVAGSRPGAYPAGYIGMAGPAHSVAAGKTLLAWLPPAQLEAYVARQLAAPSAPFPLTAPAALRAELGRIREDGYALDRGEENPDVCCVAAPVATRSDVVGAISVVGPCARLRRQQDGLIPIVLEVARAIGVLLKAAAGHEQPAAADRLEPEETTQAAIETALATLTRAMSRVG